MKLLFLAIAAVIAVPMSCLAAEPIPTVIVRDRSLSMLHTLIELAKTNLEDGDISAARARLAPAARMDIPEALRLMGNTYDPRWLLAHGALWIRYDDEKAIQYYVAASALGDEEARKILSALDDADKLLETAR